MLPLASFFASLGRPGFLGFGFWFGIGSQLPQLLKNGRDDCDLLIRIEIVRHKFPLE